MTVRERWLKAQHQGEYRIMSTSPSRSVRHCLTSRRPLIRFAICFDKRRQVPDRRGGLYSQQPVMFLFDHTIAFADHLLQSNPIEDGDTSTTVVNQSQILQASSGHRHALPPVTQHPGDELLSDE